MIDRARKLLLLAFFALSCAHYPINPQLQHVDLGQGYRFANTVAEGDNGTFVILTFSGGGTRAAGLAYAVLRQLESTTVNGHPLLDDVRVISSVSGGSFASMEYGLRGKAMLDDFERNFLLRDVQGMLIRAAFFTPSNWVRLGSPDFHRIDLAAEVYDRVLFHGKTFADLLAVQKQERRPLIIANATSLDMGSRFEWTQDQFDVICSDLAGIRVARAVAASSAFPVLLPPMIVKRYDGCGYTMPSWVALAHQDVYLNPARPRLGNELEQYRDPERRYLHLMDGGLADNIGLRAPLQALQSTDTYVQPEGGRTGFTLLPLINLHRIRRLVVIVVNAGTESAVRLDRTSAEPSLGQVISGVAGTPMDNYSFDSIQLLLELVDGRRNTATAYYPVIISFPLLKDAALRATVNGIGTSFNALTLVQLDALKKAADILLHQDPNFQQLLRDVQ